MPVKGAEDPELEPAELPLDPPPASEPEAEEPLFPAGPEPEELLAAAELGPTPDEELPAESVPAPGPMEDPVTEAPPVVPAADVPLDDVLGALLVVVPEPHEAPAKGRAAKTAARARVQAAVRFIRELLRLDPARHQSRLP